MIESAGLTSSVLFHVGIAALLLWFGARHITVLPPADEPVEMVFEVLPSPAEPVAAVPVPVPVPVEMAAPEPEMLPPAVMAAEPPPLPPVVSPAEAMPVLPEAAVPPAVVVSPPAPTPPREAPRAPARPAPPHHAAPPRPAARVPEPAASGAVLPSTGPAPVASAAAPAAIDPAWRSAMSAWLRAHQRYPEMARQRGAEGVVGVTFTVGRDGQVQAVAVTSSSGSALLDDAAREMLDRQRMPAFPAEMGQSQAQVSVKIRYSLD